MDGPCRGSENPHPSPLPEGEGFVLYGELHARRLNLIVTPAKAGVQGKGVLWIPAFAGMTKGTGMTKGAGMTKGGRNDEGGPKRSQEPARPPSPQCQLMGLGDAGETPAFPGESAYSPPTRATIGVCPYTQLLLSTERELSSGTGG